jgi:transcriptional regulator with XRE-family HTH domain
MDIKKDILLPKSDEAALRSARWSFGCSGEGGIQLSGSLATMSLRTPHTPLERVRHLRHEIGLTETDLATATGASTRTVRRWTHALDDDLQRGPNYARQIDDLDAIVTELQDSLTPKGIQQWLWARNRYLKGKRPIEVLGEGRFDVVYEAAAAFRDGVYL